MKRIFTAIVGLTTLTAVSVQATQTLVSEVGVHPTEIVSITTTIYTAATDTPDVVQYSSRTLSVYAGLNELKVGGTESSQTGGTLAYGFCIDPFHFSSSTPLLYDIVPLANAPESPKYPGAMGSTEADTIARMWTETFGANPITSVSAHNAAVLQVAIWQIVGGSNGFSYTAPGSDPNLVTDVNNLIAGAGASAPAHLMALSGGGQDYVVPNVPDGGTTIALLGLGFVGLGLARRKFQAA